MAEAPHGIGCPARLFRIFSEADGAQVRNRDVLDSKSSATSSRAGVLERARLLIAGTTPSSLNRVGTDSGSVVVLRSNVALTATTVVCPSNENCRAIIQRSQQSFIRLFCMPKPTSW